MSAAAPARPERLPYERWRRFAGCAIGLVLFVNGWSLFAPAAIGGRTSYVVTSGTSMLPHFRAGGLVLTRAQGGYRVGDIVAYRNHQLHAVVMHRIIAVDGNRFVLKGDNNNFRDSYHASAADIVGKKWVYWPGGGRDMRGLRTPMVFAFIVAALGFIAGTGITPAPRKRTSHAH